jgi:anti-anti-sigma factor
LSIRASSNDGVMVVTLAGTADAAMLSPLQAPLAEALADTPIVILDLDEPDGIDVDALRALLIRLLDEARGGELRIATRDPELRRALATARIHHLVAVHETVADATDQGTRS